MSAREVDLAADLARAVRARRRDLGLTQAELAELAEVSTRSIHELERGKVTLRLNVLLAACDALGLELVPALRRPGSRDRPRTDVPVSVSGRNPNGEEKEPDA